MNHESLIKWGEPFENAATALREILVIFPEGAAALFKTIQGAIEDLMIYPTGRPRTRDQQK